jgi:hypothetical protein
MKKQPVDGLDMDHRYHVTTTAFISLDQSRADPVTCHYSNMKHTRKGNEESRTTSWRSNNTDNGPQLAHRRDRALTRQQFPHMANGRRPLPSWSFQIKMTSSRTNTELHMHWLHEPGHITRWSLSAGGLRLVRLGVQRTHRPWPCGCVSELVSE